MTKNLTRAQRNLLAINSLRWKREMRPRTVMVDAPTLRATGSAGDWMVWKPCAIMACKGHKGCQMCENFVTGLFHTSREMPMENLLTLVIEYRNWPERGPSTSPLR